MRQRGIFPAGTTGNQTSAALLIDGENDYVDGVFYVEAVGATPTVTFQFQGSDDAAAADWIPVGYVTELTDTVVPGTARTVTAVGEYHWVFESLRRFKFVRCVVTANTNVTFRADLNEGD